MNSLSPLIMILTALIPLMWVFIVLGVPFWIFLKLKEQSSLIAALLVSFYVFLALLWAILVLMGSALESTGLNSKDYGLWVLVGIIYACATLGILNESIRIKRKEELSTGRNWTGMINESISHTIDGMTVSIINLPIQFNKSKNKKRLYKNEAFQLYEYLNICAGEFILKELRSKNRVELDIHSESVLPYKVVVSIDDNYLQRRNDVLDDDTIADIMNAIRRSLALNHISFKN